MMWLLVIDAFFIGMFIGAYIVHRDVVKIAKRESIKAVEKAIREAGICQTIR